MEEAVHTARLFGADVVLRADRAERASIVFGGFDRIGCDTLAAAAARTPFVFMALGCAGRTANSSWTFFLEPEGGVAATGALLWHPALERYGAAQLNARFAERLGRPMTGAAWAGWMSVKIALEAALRARAADPVSLREVLTGPIRFDGHKGGPLGFDASHRLVQPLYTMKGEPMEDR